MIRAGADFSTMRREMSRATQSIQSFQSNVSKSMKLVSGAIAGIGVGMGIKSAIADAMKFEAAMGQVNRLMGSSAQEFSNWANNQSSAFGMARSEAVRYGAVYANLLSGFSSGTAETMQRTQDLLKASAVVASSTGRSMEDTMERIRSGLLGNTEAIEDLGINVGINLIESTKAFRKFAGDKSWNQLDFQTQQTIRYFAIMEQAATKYGLELAQNTTSRQAQFVAQLKNAQLSLGQAFLPIYNAVLPALTRMAAALSNVMAVVAQFSQALFGGSAAKTQVKTTAAQASAVGDLGDAYDAAGKAASGAVAGFDEVNQLADSSGSGAGGPTTPADPGTVDTSAGAEAEGVSQKIKTMADNVKNFLGSIDFKPLIDSFNNLKTALAPFTETLFAGLKWFWDNILVPFGTWVVNDYLPAFLDNLSGTITFLNGAIVGLEPLASWLWDNFLKPLAAFTGGVIVSVLEGLGTSLSKIGNWMSTNQGVVTGVTVAVVAFFAAWKGMELLAFIQMSGGLAAAFGRITASIWAATGAKIANAAETVYLTALYAKDFVVAIAASTAQLVKQTAQWVLATGAMIANKIAMGASAVAQGLLTVAMIAWNVACGIGVALTTALNVALAILTSPITLVIAAIAALVAGVILLVKNWDKVKQTASDVWTGIKNVWTKASSWMKDNVIDPIANLYIGLFNGIIKGINWVIRALNSIHFDLPDWIPGIGGKGFGISISEIPPIPKLARGGIVDGATNMGNFIAGEAGAEMIVPLENTSFTDKIASALGTAVMNAMQLGSGNKSNSMQAVFELDGIAFARAFLPYSTKEGSRIGGSMIVAR